LWFDCGLITDVGDARQLGCAWSWSSSKDRASNSTTKQTKKHNQAIEAQSRAACVLIECSLGALALIALADAANEGQVRHDRCMVYIADTDGHEADPEPHEPWGGDEAATWLRRIINKQSLPLSKARRLPRERCNNHSINNKESKKDEDSVGVFADLLARKMATKKELLKRLEELWLAGCRDTQKQKNTKQRIRSVFKYSDSNGHVISAVHRAFVRELMLVGWLGVGCSCAELCGDVWSITAQAQIVEGSVWHDGSRHSIIWVFILTFNNF
jgi:hypothetical protein